jgi:hypothetical protein
MRLHPEVLHVRHGCRRKRRFVRGADLDVARRRWQCGGQRLFRRAALLATFRRGSFHSSAISVAVMARSAREKPLERPDLHLPRWISPPRRPVKGPGRGAVTITGATKDIGFPFSAMYRSSQIARSIASIVDCISMKLFLHCSVLPRG